MNLRTIEHTPAPVTIAPLKPAELHQHWEWIRGHRRLGPRLPATGLEAIIAKVPVDWKPEDAYWMLKAGQATCVLVSRAERYLGFVIYYPQHRPWSGILDLFIWMAWAAPPCLTQPEDNVPEAVLLTMQHLNQIKHSIGAEKLMFISNRRGFGRRFGFTPAYYTFWD